MCYKLAIGAAEVSFFFMYCRYMIFKLKFESRHKIAVVTIEALLFSDITMIILLIIEVSSSSSNFKSCNVIQISEERHTFDLILIYRRLNEF